jgi:hypothetical protein
VSLQLLFSALHWWYIQNKNKEDFVVALAYNSLLDFHVKASFLFQFFNKDMRLIFLALLV